MYGLAYRIEVPDGKVRITTGTGSAPHGGAAMSVVAITAPPVASPVSAGAPQRSALPPDGQWHPVLRSSAAATRLAEQVPQRDPNLPDALFARLPGPVDGDSELARLRARVIEWYLPMTVYLARRFGGRGEPLDDLIQVAAVALIKVVDRFDPARGVDFA